MFEALLARRQEEHKRGFVLAGIVAAAVYNANPFREKGAKVVSPLDFVPDYEAKQAPVQTAAEQMTALKAGLAAWQRSRKKRR
jgi:hypothetical protein